MKESTYSDQFNALTFRLVEGKDAEFINRVRNESRQWLHNDREHTLEQTRGWIGKVQWWIVLRNQIPVGYFRISEVDPLNRRLYLGMDLDPKYRGKGIAYAAYREFITKLFIDQKLNKISLEVLSHNHVAISLYEKLGFVREGAKRQDVYREGKWLDSIIMSILRKEWKP